MEIRLNHSSSNGVNNFAAATTAAVATVHDSSVNKLLYRKLSLLTRIFNLCVSEKKFTFRRNLLSFRLISDTFLEMTSLIILIVQK